MKKFTALFLAMILAAGLIVGCGGGSSEEEGGSEAATAKVIDVDLTNEEYAFGVDKDQPELLEQANAFIAKILEDGTFDEICDRYFGGGEPVAVQSAKLDSSKDQLVVATNAAFEPFEYTQGEDYYGIDMEIAALFAEELGQELVIQNMDFDAVCLSVGQHKCDIAMAGLTINEEREELVTFTDPYYQASQRLIVPSSDTSFDDCKTKEDVENVLRGLVGKKVQAAASYTGYDYAEQFTNLALTAQDDIGTSVRELSQGKTDIVVGDKYTLNEMVAAINAENG